MASARTDDAGPDRRLDEILGAYLEAVESGGPVDRSAWVAKHPDLAAELSAFFANHDHVGRLAGPLRTTAVGPDAPDLIPFPDTGEGVDRVGYFGDYELLHELGRGGMGVVYAARQVSLDRVLALKVVSSARLGPGADLQRFLREAVAAAGLDHPNVVPIYEVGEHDGRHYYGMKLVDGGSLAQQIPRLRDDPKAAAGLLARVARAVHYAHQRGVLHRDLKPANVLVDRQGRPFVADFGLARRVEGEAGLTASGSVLGTPAYMAPEQAEGRREAVTTAADVYGLGAILYELLTGQPPFQGETVLDVLAKVRDVEPQPPSKLNPAAPRDLETIALKCLEKDPGRRYASAEDLADDLGRWMDGVPIAARPANAPERAIKWARRRPTTAALLAACAVAAVAAVWGVLGTSHLRTEVRETDRRRLAEAEGRREAEAEVRRQVIARERSVAAGYSHRIAAAQAAWASNDVPTAERFLDECPAPLRRWEWHYLERLCHAERITIRGHNGVSCGVAFAPGTAQFTCPDERGALTIWDAGLNRRVGHLRGHDGTAYGVAFDRPGARLAAAEGDGSIKVWDVATGRLLRALKGHGEWAAAVAFTPDGSRIVSGGADRLVRVWDAATGEEVLSLAGHEGPVLGVALHPDGRLIASAGQDGAIILWDARSRGETRRLGGHAGASRCLAFSPDGSRLASGGADRSVRVWDVASGRETLSFRAAASRIDGLAFRPDGSQIATGALDRSVKVWDAATGKEVASYRGHTAPVFSVAFSPDGLLLASAGQDGTVKLWDATSGPEARVLQPGQVDHRGSSGALAFRPDGGVVATSGPGRGVVLWDLATGRRRPSAPGHAGFPSAIAFHPQGRLLARADGDGVVRVSDASTGDVRQTLRVDGEGIACLAFFPDGTHLVTGDGRPLAVVQGLRGKGLPPPTGGHAVRIWDVATGRERSSHPHVSPVLSVAVSPDGSRVAYGGADGTVRVRDVEPLDRDGVARALQEHSGPVFVVKFHPDGRSLASAGADGTIRVRDLGTGGETVMTPGHGWVEGIGFSPDGSRLASAGGDGVVRIWDHAAGRELLAIPGHADRVSGVAFSPDGRSLVSVGADGSVRVLDSAP